MKIKLFFKTWSRWKEYTNTYCVHNVHNSTVVNRRGGGYRVCHIIFLNSLFHIQKGVQVIIGLKSNIRNMSMLQCRNTLICLQKGFSDIQSFFSSTLQIVLLLCMYKKIQLIYWNKYSAAPPQIKQMIFTSKFVLINVAVPGFELSSQSLELWSQSLDLCSKSLDQIYKEVFICFCEHFSVHSHFHLFIILRIYTYVYIKPICDPCSHPHSLRTPLQALLWVP